MTDSCDWQRVYGRDFDTVAPSPDPYCRLWLQMTSPAQGGSASFLHSGTKWRRVFIYSLWSQQPPYEATMMLYVAAWLQMSAGGVFVAEFICWWREAWHWQCCQRDGSWQGSTAPSEKVQAGGIFLVCTPQRACYHVLLCCDDIICLRSIHIILRIFILTACVWVYRSKIPDWAFFITFFINCHWLRLTTNNSHYIQVIQVTHISLCIVIVFIFSSSTLVNKSVVRNEDRMKTYADLFFMNIFLKEFHGQLHFLLHRHLDYQLILHILRIKAHRGM